MGLNLSRRNDIYLATSDRLMHYLGNGVMVLTDRATGFDDLFTDDEMIFYTDLDDLVSKARHYASDNQARRKIAESGWTKAHDSFNEQLVAKYLMEATFEHAFSENYLWPVDIHKVS